MQGVGAEHPQGAQQLLHPQTPTWVLTASLHQIFTAL